MIKSEFMTWFVLQHGERKNCGIPSKTDQQLLALVQAGRAAELALACRELWDEKQTSALYAWQACKSTGKA